jgi:hypothetical protein
MPDQVRSARHLFLARIGPKSVLLIEEIDWLRVATQPIILGQIVK